MSFNLYARLRNLFPDARLQVGTVSAVNTDSVTVTLPDGALLRARGGANVGDKVYLRDGVIEGSAPDLQIVEIEI
ncbi:hypothetical protein [Propionivibrio limicola]|uniref:hypothetical protein n=1 Tax=Propionivibrio limicola TaxID=167645 RepID=UPI001290AD98|nr:hypothetical protein [Propionivibrio limicola]